MAQQQHHHRPHIRSCGIHHKSPRGVFSVVLRMLLLPLLLLLGACPSPFSQIPSFAAAMKVDGATTLVQGELAYLADFAIGPEGGAVSWSIVASVNPAALAFYSSSDWVAANDPACNCTCKQALAEAGGGGARYSADDDDASSGRGWWVFLPAAGGNADEGTLPSLALPNAKPGYIYASLLTCAQPAAITWHIHFTRVGGEWPEIPYDALGLLEGYAISTAASGALLLALILVNSWWSQKYWFFTPPPVKAFALAIVLWLMSCACILTHFVKFAADGYGQASVEGFGRVLDVFDRLVFTGVLLGVALGWGVRPGGMSLRRRCCAGAAVAALVAVYIIMAVWYFVDRQPGDVTYVYDSVPGITVCVVQALTALWFCAAAVTSANKEPRLFLKRWLWSLAVVFTVYFLAFPVTVLIAALTLPSYQDEAAVELALQTSRLIFYSILFQKLRPSTAERVFAAWAPDAGVVKLLRPEISSVDLLTPVLSGYASPTSGGAAMGNGASSTMPRLYLGGSSRRMYSGTGSGQASTGSRTPKGGNGGGSGRLSGSNNNGGGYGTNGGFSRSSSNGSSGSSAVSGNATPILIKVGGSKPNDRRVVVGGGSILEKGAEGRKSDDGSLMITVRGGKDGMNFNQNNSSTTKTNSTNTGRVGRNSAGNSSSTSPTPSPSPPSSLILGIPSALESIVETHDEGRERRSTSGAASEVLAILQKDSSGVIEEDESIETESLLRSSKKGSERSVRTSSFRDNDDDDKGKKKKGEEEMTAPSLLQGLLMSEYLSSPPTTSIVATTIAASSLRPDETTSNRKRSESGTGGGRKRSGSAKKKVVGDT